MAPGDLIAKARALAQQLGSIPVATFALAKRQEPRPVLERIAMEHAATGADIVRAWNARDIRERMRAFVEQRVG